MIEPIFITGFERSGTTLLRRIVSMCPGLQYNLLHEKRELLKYNTPVDAFEKYHYPAKQGGVEIGGTDSIVAGEKIPYRDNAVFVGNYIKRWFEWWPDGMVFHIGRDINSCANSANKTFHRDIPETKRMYTQSVRYVEKVLSRLSVFGYNVFRIKYEWLIKNPVVAVGAIYRMMGYYDATPEYIKQVCTTKDPFEYNGRMMVGLRYKDGIK